MAASRADRLARPFAGSSLAIFNFHRLSTNAETPFDDWIIGPTPEAFRSDLIALAREADAVSESDLIDSLAGRLRLPKRAFMITFDDGYRDNYDFALPVLRELSIPAIFFVPTEAIENRVLGWWDQISWFLKRTKKSRILFRGREYEIERPVRALAERLGQAMKTLKASETVHFLDELGAACEVEQPSREICDAELMTWKQIAECDRAGITIGAHTHTHRVLAALDEAAQREELTVSKAILEQKLGKRVRSVAYPVGGYEHFQAATMRLAEECGYELGFSFQTGVNRPGIAERFDIKRLAQPLHPAIYPGIFAFPRVFAPTDRRPS